jgi:hypothetical protein
MAGTAGIPVRRTRDIFTAPIKTKLLTVLAVELLWIRNMKFALQESFISWAIRCEKEGDDTVQ